MTKTGTGDMKVTTIMPLPKQATTIIK